MNQLVKSEKLGSQVAMTNSAGGFAVTPQTLSDIVEFARFMCQSNAGIPAFLRGNGPDCAAVIMQAMKWGFDPFSVAQKSYKVKDIIAYEAQLIAAVINARSGIKGRLRYEFAGEGDDLTCTVTGNLDGVECVYTSPRVGNITTKNSPLWKTDPQQQLGYYSARNWARRHCPEVILGAYDRDEAEEFRGPERAKNITPTFDPLSDEPPASRRVAIDETAERGGAGTEQEPSSDVSTDDAGGEDTADGGAGDAGAPIDTAEADGAGDGAADGQSAAPAPGELSDEQNKKLFVLEECADAMFAAATHMNASERVDRLDKVRMAWLAELPKDKEFVQKAYETCARLIENPTGRDQVMPYLKGQARKWLGVL
jgi:hypothetical protein